MVWVEQNSPECEWRVFRTWKKQANGARLENANVAAVAKYCKRCRRCGKINNPGHMHTTDVCSNCAESEMGRVY